MSNLTFKSGFVLVIVGAIIFTASFLWKDLLNDIQDAYLPKHHILLYRTISTLIITILLVALAVYLQNKFAQPSSSTTSESVPSITFDDSPIDD